jgi:hypothetical protein
MAAEVETDLLRDILGTIPTKVEGFFLRRIDFIQDKGRALRMQRREIDRRSQLWGNGWTGLLLTDFVTASFISASSKDDWRQLMTMFDESTDIILEHIRKLIPQHEKELRRLLAEKEVTRGSSRALIEPMEAETNLHPSQSSVPPPAADFGSSTTDTDDPQANSGSQSAAGGTSAPAIGDSLPFMQWNDNSCSLDAVLLLLMALFAVNPSIWTSHTHTIGVAFRNGMEHLSGSWNLWTSAGMTNLRDTLRSLLENAKTPFIIDINSSARNILEELLPTDTWCLNIRQTLICSKHDSFAGEVKKISAYYRQGSQSRGISTQVMMDEMVRRPYSLFLTRARLKGIFKTSTFNSNGNHVPYVRPPHMSRLIRWNGTPSRPRLSCWVSLGTSTTPRSVPP